MSDMDEDQLLAEESSKTKKTREKLRKYLQEMDENVTPQALKRKSLEIHRWISRHAPHRIVLKSKSISLFDENQNTADRSQKISELMLRLGDHK
ncbi:hypothetical protein [Simkania negevensis]|uniref:Uncharacterized protein n=1 Tax=Simkania negevensis (strain ATCC VR-1471 / DSM 27360 / Z) TaxID=331113 RepID=F8L7E0_SIMNZ|nr:hypothetical protein [Simkania negevensis]MCB1067911.1 hypothetical protein [Simkania sp.]MCB1075329.1 hypothetical protein [Simkania sp.]MCP5490005.1 hypothetical protein [Chlamydiales bacterium]CCB88669.1 unknown protein [Simkania negevensis Z]